MKRILSGIQSSGTPHLGNYLGAMKNHIEMQKDHECFIFIADLHALTTVRDPEKMRSMIREIAIDYLALGLDPDKTVFFRQSDLPEHSELAWILSTVTPLGLLERAHAFKDATAKGMKEPSTGLFTYPVLMAADILLYKPDLVPVGKDQKQHIEIARDIAEKFNNTYGEVFPLPDPYIPDQSAYIIGTDGKHKMSKSYGNVIEFFADEKTLKKQVMSIVTDSTPMQDPKDPAKCAVYKLYAYFATPEEQKTLADKYKKGGFGYGDAKKILLAKLLEYFAPYRQKRIELQSDLGYIDTVLREGAKKARKVANKTMAEVREKTGLNFK
ncbi:tryptophan--tRNA ligase [Patescibacteria group bacterium]|nr:tryptophan--tRNA ligase [Patescibacteria group bacterium]MBU1703133.1 tryptophan--tRNA ligase [Patescibacteria group bacterium]MBU1953875.1 tryptophan--tRNA ligase [Patescibacteria group bacterium]